MAAFSKRTGSFKRGKVPQRSAETRHLARMPVQAVRKHCAAQCVRGRGAYLRSALTTVLH